MSAILPKKSLPAWLKTLAGRDLLAPRRRGGTWSYEPVEDAAAVSLEYPNTAVAPKRLVFPQREVLLDFETAADGSPAVTERLPEPPETVVLGVRPCDARALTLTDRVLGGDPRDPYYAARREATVIVGLGCAEPPSPNCFCTSVGGSPHSTGGMDVLMTDLGGRYHLEALTARGKKLLAGAGKTLQATGDADEKERRRVVDEAAAKIGRRIEAAEEMPGRLAGLFDSGLWDEQAMSCLRCGICTFLCPTCHCFDIADEVRGREPLRGERVRTWDTCQFPDFTMHSSGHNPRPDKAARLRQRIMHKFRYFPDTHGEYQCTGCGRCISLCPVGIDIIEVLDEVRTHGA